MKNILRPEAKAVIEGGSFSIDNANIDADEPELRQEFIDEMMEIEKEESIPLTSFDDLFGEE